MEISLLDPGKLMKLLDSLKWSFHHTVLTDYAAHDYDQLILVASNLVTLLIILCRSFHNNNAHTIANCFTPEGQQRDGHVDDNYRPSVNSVKSVKGLYSISVISGFYYFLPAGLGV